MNENTPDRGRQALLDLVRAIADRTSPSDQAVAVVRHVLQKKRVRFADVPLVQTLRVPDPSGLDDTTHPVPGAPSASG